MEKAKNTNIYSILKKVLPDWAIVFILLVLAVLIAAILTGLIWNGITGASAANRAVVSKAFSGPSWSYIAKVKVVGPIGSNASVFQSSDQAYHHAWTLQTIDTLIKDENNKGIYLWMDTPGGGVYESDELYLKLMEYKEKTERPIYVYMGKLAASGGYYIAMSSDEIYANRNTWTGSIGVTLGTLYDISGFLDEHGIKTETITSGRNKAMGNYYEPLTDEQRKIYQSLVDETYERFVAIVKEGRSMDDDKARKLADGRIYTAYQALEAGLIDAVMGEKEAEEAIKAKFEDGTEFYTCYYRPDRQFTLFSSGGFDIWDLIGGNTKAGNTKADNNPEYQGDLAAVLELMRELEEAGAPPLKYLYTG